MGIIDTLREQTLGTYERAAESFAEANGLTGTSFNAAAHVFTSAMLARDYGLGTAKSFGDWLEVAGTVRDSTSNLSVRIDRWKDSYKDLWNNDIGRKIGELARQQNLTDAEVGQLIVDAFNNGDTIVDEHTDPRVPDPETSPVAVFGIIALPSVLDQFYQDRPDAISGNTSGGGGGFCFAFDTQITLANQTSTAIQDICVGTEVLCHDYSGNPATGHVTRLLPNTTQEFYLLDNGTYVTPGHLFTRPDGAFLEIEHVLKGDGLMGYGDSYRILCRMGVFSFDVR